MGVNIKELKELNAKASKGPWHYEIYPERLYFQVSTEMDAIATNSCCYNEYNDNDAKLIAASRNALPELIRVIELAEESLSQVNEKSHFVPAIVQDALSEIKKLKGE